MKSIEVTVERSAFPLTRFSIVIGESDFNLRPGEIKRVKLPDSDEYDIIASSYWLKKKVNLQLDDNSEVKIKHGLPDAFYLVGMPLIVLLSILTFFDFISVSLLSVALLIYFVPLLYITFLKTDSYFKIFKKGED